MHAEQERRSRKHGGGGRRGGRRGGGGGFGGPGGGPFMSMGGPGDVRIMFMDPMGSDGFYQQEG